MISAYVHPYSNVLNMETDVRLIMPDLNEDKRPLPCIYLCHGGSGDEDAWLCFGGIGELADRYRTAFSLFVSVSGIIFSALPFCQVERLFLPLRTKK